VQLDMAVNSLMLDLVEEVSGLEDFLNTDRTFETVQKTEPIETDKTAPRDTIEQIETIEKAEVKAEKELSRKEKIKLANQKKKEQEEEESTQDATEIDFSSYAFVDYIDDEDFRIRFKEAEDRLDEYIKDEEEQENENSGVYVFSNKNIIDEAVALNKKKIVAVNPKYIVIGAGRNGQYEYLESEEKSFELQQQIIDIGKKSKLNVQLLDVNALSADESSKFNKLTELENYLSEQMFFPNKGLHPSSNQNKINQIADELGTDYFLWTGLISKDVTNLTGIVYSGFALVPPYLNSILFDTYILNAVSFQYAILCDVRTGKRQVLKLDTVPTKYSKTMLDAHLYDVFNQIYTKEDKKKKEKKKR